MVLAFLLFEKDDFIQRLSQKKASAIYTKSHNIKYQQ